MKPIQDLLTGLGFVQTYQVEGRVSIVDLFVGQKSRCGLYVLHFADGQYYAGQSVDIARRFAEHCFKHPDIHYISIKFVSQEHLNDEEKQIISVLESDNYRLRNIHLVSFSYAVTDFDLVMRRDNQERWLKDVKYADNEGARVVDDHLRQNHQYKAKYQTLLKKPFAQKIIELARQYIQTSVPAVKRSEMSFWNCSCLPYPSLYIRINVGWQTVFDIGVEEGKLFSRWYLTQTEAEKVFWVSLKDIETYDWTLQGGGLRQVFIETYEEKNILKLLSNLRLLKAIRRFNLGLVQKSPCPWGRNHCLDLADHLV
jgi:hypothetical protein